MTKLSELTVLVRRLEDAIQKLRKGMAHVSPGSVNIFRKNVHELENILELILNEAVTSEVDIEQALTNGNDCIKECIRPVYTGKVTSIPPYQLPTDDGENTPPTASGVHLILYLDATPSMKYYYKGQFGNDLKRLVDYLKNQCTLYNIPATCSVIWFGDTSSDKPYEIVTNGQPLDKITEAVSNPMILSAGGTTPESGLYSIEKTIDTVYNPSMDNTIIFATNAASKDDDFDVTPQTVQDKLDSLGIDLRFGVIPTRKKPDILFLFDEVRNMKDKSTSFNLVPWGYRLLHP